MTVDSILKLVLNNFGFISMVIGVAIAVARGINGKPFFEELFRWSVFWGVGVNCVYSGLGHLFLPDYSAELIGWEDSPFQLEVGSADLAMGVVGVLSIWGNYGFRLAIALVAAIFYGIDALGHVRQMAIANNFATGNAGSWFWIDILMPIILVVSAAKCGLRSRNSESPTPTA